MSTPVKLDKAPADSICATRISIGGTEGQGYYCTYRGNLAKCIETTERALEIMKLAQIHGQEPKVNRAYRELGAS